MHPNLNELCGIARAAGLNVHLTTHFSYNLSDAKIRSLADSGVTHVTVSLDGSSQEVYGSTRIRGRYDWVVSNLRRLLAYRRSRSRKYPIVEVQYIPHDHHPPGEEERVRAISTDCGADEFSTITPYPLSNIVDEDPDNFTVGTTRARGIVPNCSWMFTSMVVKYNGDVIPCCNYRAARQHTNLDDQRVAGNILKESLSDVWNGKAYRDMRRLASKPSLAEGDTTLKQSFCYGCPVLMERKSKLLA